MGLRHCMNVKGTEGEEPGKQGRDARPLHPGKDLACLVVLGPQPSPKLGFGLIGC